MPQSWDNPTPDRIENWEYDPTYGLYFHIQQASYGLTLDELEDRFNA